MFARTFPCSAVFARRRHRGVAGARLNFRGAPAASAKYVLGVCRSRQIRSLQIRSSWNPGRKNLATRAAELQGLMAKAGTGVAGPVVAELAYRNEYISVRAQQKLADEAWQRNKCHETPAAAAAPAPPAAPSPSAKGGRQSRFGSAALG